VAKAASGHDAARDAAREALADGHLTTGELEQLIRDLWADSYFAGTHAALEQTGGSVTGTLGGALAGMDWGTWRPGDMTAAALAADGGLASLLAEAGAAVRGITGTTLDMLGNRIADGLASGLSVDQVARTLRDLVGGASRAEMIAHTETARAMVAATMGVYSGNGIGDWNLITTEGACQTCLDVEAGNPHPVGDTTGLPPLHPRCRCAPAPGASATTAATTGLPMGSGLSLADLGLSEADLAGAGETAAPGAEVGEVGEDLAALSDEDLSGRLGDAAADPEQLDRVLAELDRRDEQARTAAAKEAKRAAREEAKDAEFNKLVDAGHDPTEAYAQVYGVSAEKQAREQAISSLRGNGYHGKGFDELARAAFKDHAEQSFYDAEDVTRGHMLNKAGQAAGIDPRSLFTGAESRARKYASEDLLEYFERHGRLTLNDFVDGLLGGAKRSQATGYWR
jgi:hypothetical protein